jgi:hypothetical protein
MPQMLRSFCGANVATLYAGRDTQSSLTRLADKSAAENREFFVVAKSPSAIVQIAPTAKFTRDTTVTNQCLLTQTFTHRPSSYESQAFPLVIASLPTQ